MASMGNIIWAATPVTRRGTRYYPHNWGSYGEAMFAALVALEDGDYRYSSGGSYDPYRIFPHQVDDVVSSLSRPLDVVFQIGLAA